MVQVQIYEDILNHLPDSICVIDARTNKVKYTNDTFSDKLLSRNLIIGQTFESQVLQDGFKETFFKAIEEAKSSPNEIVIGSCKSLSTIGNDECKF